MASFSSASPIILGCLGTTLNADEKAFLEDANPFGLILFKRNCSSPEQIRALTFEIRHLLGRDDLPIFIDQEGGRVARLGAPYWPVMPSMAPIGNLYARDHEAGLSAMQLHAEITSSVLLDLGIDGNCAPVLDLSIADTSDVMGDRTFSSDPLAVIALGTVAVETYLDQGVFPVIKHMPGHGRVKVDPHKTLPFVDASIDQLEKTDFKPFIALADIAPMAMSAHIIFRSIDDKLPASLSLTVHEEIFRGKLGYDGLIMSDDLAMGAIDLPLGQAGRLVLEAGSDIALYCHGDIKQGMALCSDMPSSMGQDCQRRVARAFNQRKGAVNMTDYSDKLMVLDKLLSV